MSSSLDEVHLSGKYVIWAAIITSIATIAGAWITISDRPPEETYKINQLPNKKPSLNQETPKLEISSSFLRGQFIVHYTSETGEKIEIGYAKSRKDIFISPALSKVGFIESPNFYHSETEGDNYKKSVAIFDYTSRLRIVKANGDFDKSWDLTTNITINADKSESHKMETTISNEVIQSAGWVDDNTLRVYLNSRLGFTFLGDTNIPESGEYDLTIDQYNTITNISKVKSVEINNQE